MHFPDTTNFKFCFTVPGPYDVTVNVNIEPNPATIGEEAVFSCNHILEANRYVLIDFFIRQIHAYTFHPLFMVHTS